ncbi:MAG: MATE family efflux transporter [Catenisphaera adipataccumulans]|jgi:putative MATE family efflux protein|uniref:MATE family efflux transporter n=1 Tax=Catenisphaera adipataccumulans TaxID=700500 RepID=UPI003D8D0CB4
MTNQTLTEGKVLQPLLKFTLPVMIALFLQSLYGAVDLLIVGQFASSVDVSAVSTGSQLMQIMTYVMASLSMGTTILVGRAIGKQEPKRAGEIIGTSVVFFGVLAVIFSFFIVLSTGALASILQAPAEAYSATCDYIRICGAGMICITGYNLFSSIFRGLGNSMIPMVTVILAAIMNISGDLILVRVFHMGAAGAAYATVFSQAMSVLISLIWIRHLELPVTFHRTMIRWNSKDIKKIFQLGFPLSISDFLVGLSFLVILAIVNQFGVTASAGIGVAEKVCAFIMIVPTSFSQSMSAFVAQNQAAGKPDRSYKGLRYGILTALGIGFCMSLLTYFHGNLLCQIFTKDPEVVQIGFAYLRSYAIDCCITPIFFNIAGFLNGCGHTNFVMAENLIGGIGVRLPAAWIFSRMRPVSFFRIGLSTPCASAVQTILCIFYLTRMRKKTTTK